ncbi:VanZ family protein [Bacillus sp. FJAT-27245]|uniref:VanZ family protein n=1 Tax=Bacillus sp. FJAT-27245 TaxID=1684144 RepID=UPI0006A7DECB|nr:VanZ family protein [Bacillus sp. FJAT-27245]
MKNILKACVWLCFSFYMAVLFYLLFFSSYRTGVKGIVDYNLIPFRTIERYFSSWNGFGPGMATDEFFGNIFAFFPFGFFLPLLFGKLATRARIATCSFMLSLSVETAQFAFAVGAFDVDDLILNTFGGMIGYGMYALGKSIFTKNKKIPLH